MEHESERANLIWLYSCLASNEYTEEFKINALHTIDHIENVIYR